MRVVCVLCRALVTMHTVQKFMTTTSIKVLHLKYRDSKASRYFLLLSWSRATGQWPQLIWGNIEACQGQLRCPLSRTWSLPSGFSHVPSHRLITPPLDLFKVTVPRPPSTGTRWLQERRYLVWNSLAGWWSPQTCWARMALWLASGTSPASWRWCHHQQRSADRLLVSATLILVFPPQVNNSTILGASGDYADYQHLKQVIEQMV